MTIKTNNGSIVTDEQLDEVANSFERGDWPEGETRILREHPRAFDEEPKPSKSSSRQ